MRNKQKVDDEIVVDADGTPCVGRRTIEGTRKLYQTIYYRGKSKADGHPYSPDESALMDNIARTILRELVQDSSRRR